MSYKITDEEKNKVKMSSPFALPTSPSERGMKPDSIKNMFWKPFLVLIDLINKYLDTVATDFEAHNSSTEVHSGIRELIKQSAARIEEVKASLETSLTESVKDHNSSDSAHSDIREAVKLVHNLASGKSRVYPAKDVEDFLNVLDTEELHRGDMIVTGTRDMPDFMVYSLTDEDAINAQFTKENLLNGAFSFEKYTTGLFYFYADKKIQLLAIESGIDTSLFATTVGVGIEIDRHNLSEEAHSDIRALIEQAVSQLEASLTENIQTHNQGQDTHSDIRERAESAYSLAEVANTRANRGKIYCEDTPSLAFSALFNSNAFEQGDMFMFVEKNVPDLIVFDISAQPIQTDGAIELTYEQFLELVKSNSFTVEAGGRYRLAGSNYGVVAIESGIDTSVLAAKEELEAVSARVDELEAGYGTYEEIATITLEEDTSIVEFSGFELSGFYISALAGFADGAKSGLYMQVNDLSVLANATLGLTTGVERGFMTRVKTCEDGFLYAWCNASALNNFFNSQIGMAKEIFYPPTFAEKLSTITKIKLYTLTPSDGTLQWVKGSTFTLWGIRKNDNS